MILQGVSVILWLLIVPFLIGLLILSLFQREEQGFCLIFVTGYLTIFGSFQVMALPMIFAKQPFHRLYYLAAGCYLLLAVLSVLRNRKAIGRLFRDLAGYLFYAPWTVYAAIAAVGFQCFMYVFYAQENADDAYYVAAASTTLVYDSMYLRSPYTGVINPIFNPRYVCSPYPVFQAFLSKSLHVPAAVIAHSVWPPILLCIAYAGYVCLGRLLFSENGLKGETAKKTQKLTGLFVMLLSWIHITSYYCMKTSGAILLIRVWQGKATLGAVILPIVFFLCYRMALYKEEKGNVLILFFAALAGTLASSMGIAMVPFMAGIFAFLFGVLRRNLRYVFLIAAGITPCILIGLANLLLRFIQ